MLPQWHNIATWARSPFPSWREGNDSLNEKLPPLVRPDLHTLWLGNPANLPLFVQESESAMKYLKLLGPLNWADFPERDERKAWPGVKPAPRAPFVAAFLIKLDKGLPSMPKLYEYLLENPALVWLLGFPLKKSAAFSWGFDVRESLCTIKHFSRILRELDNNRARFLFDGTVQLLSQELDGLQLPSGESLDAKPFGDEISVDTKHIIAWVVENNPKAYLSNRYDKTNQPKGDADCKLGCKDRKNQKSTKKASAIKTHDGSENTPTQEGMEGSKTPPGEFYWGYKTGLVATKVPGWGEFVLAERTTTFNESDASFFKPLMARTEKVLGRPPTYGAFDAAFDAFYVYEYFHLLGGMAAAPLKNTGHHRVFTEENVPLCKADIEFSLKYTYNKKASVLYPHRRQRYACPLLFPEQTADCCPIGDKRWKKGGCTLDIPESIGSRIRHQIDRKSDAYKQLYKQRTATERVNSQAKELGIERPKLRNKGSVTNQNTLIYILINMRALQRVQLRKQDLAQQAEIAIA